MTGLFSLLKRELATFSDENGMSDITVLFAREDSIYKSFSSTDVFDIKRNALN